MKPRVDEWPMNSRQGIGSFSEAGESPILGGLAPLGVSLSLVRSHLIANSSLMHRLVL
jgi:hypothetical protein